MNSERYRLGLECTRRKTLTKGHEQKQQITAVSAFLCIYFIEAVQCCLLAY